MPPPRTVGTVAALSSFVMRGAVGLRASQFALERRGHTVWPVPTVLLPWHPGLGPSSRTVPAEFGAQLRELAGQGAGLDAVFTGYFATAEQIEAAATFIDTVREARPGLIVLVDPVMGDENGRYVPDAVAEAMRAELVSRADIITPNPYELFDLTEESDPATAASATRVRCVVGTSAAGSNGRIGTRLWSPAGDETVWHRAVAPAPRGTGDLFAALFLAARLEGLSEGDALTEAAAATLAVADISPAQTLALQAAQSAIAQPPRHLIARAPS